MSQVVKKQYVMVLDDAKMAILGHLFQGAEFVEIQAMPIQGDPGHQLLVTPTYQKTEEVPEVEHAPARCC